MFDFNNYEEIEGTNLNIVRAYRVMNASFVQQKADFTDDFKASPPVSS